MNNNIELLFIMEVITDDQFIDNFNLFTENIFIDFNWNNVVVWGESLVASLYLLPSNIKRIHDKRIYYQKKYKDFDINLYFYNLSGQEATNKLKYLYNHLEKKIPYKLKHYINKYITITSNNNLYRNIKINTTIFNTVDEILLNIVTDCCSICYNGKKILCTDRYKLSMTNKKNKIISTNLNNEELILYKFYKHGYKIDLVNINEDLIDPQYFKKNDNAFINLYLFINNQNVNMTKNIIDFNLDEDIWNKDIQDSDIFLNKQNLKLYKAIANIANNNKIIKLINKDNINKKDPMGRTPLVLSILYNRYDACKILVDNNVKITNKFILLAIEQNNLDIFKLLYKNYNNKYIYHCILFNSYDIFYYLINNKDINYKVILNLCSVLDRVNYAKYFINKIENTTKSLLLAIKYKSSDFINFLLEQHNYNLNKHIKFNKKITTIILYTLSLCNDEYYKELTIKLLFMCNKIITNKKDIKLIYPILKSNNIWIIRTIITLHPELKNHVFHDNKRLLDYYLETNSTKIISYLNEIKCIASNNYTKDINITNDKIHNILHNDIKVENDSELLITHFRENRFDLINELIDKGLILDNNIFYKIASEGLIKGVMYMIKYKSFKLDKSDILHKICSTENTANEDNYINLIKMILELQPELLDKVNSLGITPLIEAVIHNNVVLVQLLLELGAYINHKDNNSWTVLHHAVKNNNTILLDILLRYNYDLIDIKTNEGYTPLILSAKNNYKESTKYLFNRGSNYFCSDIFGNTVYHYLATNGIFSDIIHYFNIENRFGLTPLDYTRKIIRKGCYDTIVKYRYMNNKIITRIYNNLNSIEMYKYIWNNKI